MQPTTIGLFVGLLLGLAAAIAGFSGFLVTAVLGGLGWIVAGQVSGRLDVRELIGRNNG